MLCTGSALPGEVQVFVSSKFQIQFRSFLDIEALTQSAAVGIYLQLDHSLWSFACALSADVSCSTQSPAVGVYPQLDRVLSGATGKGGLVYA